MEYCRKLKIGRSIKFIFQSDKRKHACTKSGIMVTFLENNSGTI